MHTLSDLPLIRQTGPCDQMSASPLTATDCGMQCPGVPRLDRAGIISAFANGPRLG